MNSIEKAIKHKIKRNLAITKENNEKFHGNESKYTFHGGFNSGYFAGKLAALEDIADLLGIDLSDLEQK